MLPAARAIQGCSRLSWTRAAAQLVPVNVRTIIHASIPIIVRFYASGAGPTAGRCPAWTYTHGGKSANIAKRQVIGNRDCPTPTNNGQQGESGMKAVRIGWAVLCAAVFLYFASDRIADGDAARLVGNFILPFVVWLLVDRFALRRQ